MKSSYVNLVQPSKVLNKDSLVSSIVIFVAVFKLIKSIVPDEYASCSLKINCEH